MGRSEINEKSVEASHRALEAARASERFSVPKTLQSMPKEDV